MERFQLISANGRRSRGDILTNLKIFISVDPPVVGEIYVQDKPGSDKEQIISHG